MEKFRFSVFTATYNRANLLPRVYKCLLKQTFKDFEWIIVDDGSTDETEKVCEGFIENNKLNIQYIKKDNGGKHTAWWIATRLFNGRYIVGADDDDSFPENFLQIFNTYWIELEKSKYYHDFWEIRGRCIFPNGKLVGNPLPSKVFDSDYNEMTYMYKYKEEMHGCRKVEVLRNEAAVPEDFIYDSLCSNFPESIRWSRAARKFKTRFVDEIVRCYNRNEGIESLTTSNRKRRNSKRTFNTLIGSIYTLKEQKDLLLSYDLKSYIKTLAVLVYTSICLRKNPFTLDVKFHLSENILMVLLWTPLYLIFIFRK